MAVPRFVRYAGQGYVGQYIHLGGKIGVQVEFGGVTPAMARPARSSRRSSRKSRCRSRRRARPTSRATDVPADVLEKEKAIYRAQMEDSGKPANVIDKIVEGKLGSFYSQVVLPDQPSIRDPKDDASPTCIAAAAKALGATGHGDALRAAQGRRSRSSAADGSALCDL